MIDLDFIERLIRVLDESGLDSLEVERGGTRVRLAKTPTGGLAPVSVVSPGLPVAPASAPASHSDAPGADGGAAPEAEPQASDWKPRRRDGSNGGHVLPSSCT